MSDLLSFVNSLNTERKSSYPSFRSGDTLKVHLKVKEGNKERIQIFEGIVIQRKNPNTAGETFTVIKYVGDIYVEKIFPILCPTIEKIELVMQGRVRRARIFYMRERRGKAARIKEKKTSRK